MSNEQFTLKQLVDALWPSHPARKEYEDLVKRAQHNGEAQDFVRDAFEFAARAERAGNFGAAWNARNAAAKASGLYVETVYKGD